MKKSLMLLTALIILLGAITLQAAPPPPPNYQVSTSYPQLQNEEQIWVHPQDSLVLIAVWRDFRLGYRQIGIGRSTDGGNTWTDKLVSEVSYDRQSDPCVDVDAEGNMYICFMDWDPAPGGRSGLTVVHSMDKGANWWLPATYETPTSIFFDDKQFITFDRTGGAHDGNFYMAWARFDADQIDPNRIMFIRSTDSVDSYDAPIEIGPVQDFSSCGLGSNWDGGQFAQPIVGSDGSVYTFWVGSDTVDCVAHSAIKIVKSTDGGVSFTNSRRIKITYGNYTLIDGGVDVYNAPICAADIFGGTYDGNIYVSYANMDMSNTDYYDFNIEFIRSSDGGENWSDPIYINDDVTGPGAMHDQFLPWLFCNEEGTLMIIFYDQRLDPNHFNFDVYAAYSFDGGQSFTTNHRISDVSIDPDDLPPPPDPELPGNKANKAGLIAEYIGLTAFKDHINAVWTDTRNGNQDVFGANWVLPILEPRLLTPSNGEALDDGAKADLVFTWATAWKETDDQYRLEVSDDPLFGTFLVNEVLTAPYYATSGISSDGEYYWRVKAFQISTGDSSEYSNEYSFIIDTYIPISPTLFEPVDEFITSKPNPEFIWSSEANSYSALTYDIEVSPDVTFTNSALIRSYTGLIDTILVSLDPIYLDSVYHWRVQAKNRWDETVGYSASFSVELDDFVCGDVNRDTDVNLTDILDEISYVYVVPLGEPEPDPPASGDVNDDGVINLTDILELISNVYVVPLGEPILVCP